MLSIQDSERYSDESDRASFIEAEANSAAIEAVRMRAAPEADASFDGKACIDCQEPIPKLRLAMGRVRCVSCQEIKENRSRFHV